MNRFCHRMAIPNQMTYARHPGRRRSLEYAVLTALAQLRWPPMPS
jgi:hypothetical protein